MAVFYSSLHRDHLKFLYVEWTWLWLLLQDWGCGHMPQSSSFKVLPIAVHRTYEREGKQLTKPLFVFSALHFCLLLVPLTTFCSTSALPCQILIVVWFCLAIFEIVWNSKESVQNYILSYSLCTIVPKAASGLSVASGFAARQLALIFSRMFSLPVIIEISSSVFNPFVGITHIIVTDLENNHACLIKGT